MKYNLPTAHPDHRTILSEAHARPFLVLTNPVIVTQLVMLQTKLTHTSEVEHLCLLCEELGGPEPESNSRLLHLDFGRFEIHWQQHLEYSTYRFIRPTSGKPFEQSALEYLPQDWLSNIPGELISAMDVQTESYQAEETTNPDRLKKIFNDKPPVGSEVRKSLSMLWSRFEPCKQGFVRYLLQVKNLAPAQNGRLVNRVLEMEGYRLLALLSTPMIKKLRPQIDRIDFAMLLIADHIKRISSIDDQQSLLTKLSTLAAEVEVLGSHDYRFSASHAYFDLFDERLDELQEKKLSATMTAGEFIQRRMTPARRTLRHTQRRISELSRRISHARELLQTNINMTIEHQNQELLLSMEKRSHLQLRLQEAVEGLSIAAISYYLVSLTKYLLVGLKSVGIHLNKDLFTALAVPVVIFAVWFTVHKIKDHVLENHEE